MTDQGPDGYVFGVADTAFCCWEYDRVERNVRFLSGLDAEYYGRLAEILAEHLDGDGGGTASLALRVTDQRSRYLVEHATDVADLRHIDDVIARRVDEMVIEAEDDSDHYLRRAVGAPPVGSRRRQVWRDRARAVEQYRMT